MTLQSGKMYRPSDIAVDITGNCAFVVETFNHRISKWNYTPGATPPANFVFTLDAGQVTSITVTNGGTGYTVGDQVDISAPTLNIANPVNATAEVGTETAGVIDTVTVTEAGNGYDPNNLPTVTATTGGSGAILAAVVSTPWGSNGDGTTGKPGPIQSTTDDNFYRPTGIVLNGDELVVTDTFHNRLKRIKVSDGSVLGTVGTGGTGTGGDEFYYPTGIDISGTHIMIADENNHRCQAYTNAKPPVFVAISDQPTPKTFIIPRGVSYNTFNDDFYVSSARRGFLNQYDGDGQNFVAQFGEPGTDINVNSELFYPGGGHTLVAGDSLTAFANTRNNRIKNVNGTSITDNFSTNIDTPGTGDGEMYWPNSVIKFDDTGFYLLVANTRNHRVEVFDQNGVFKNNFGSP